jgi:outer membrane biosynthesis protein TonB
VIQQAAPAVNAKALDLSKVAPINAPKDIAHTTVVAEQVRVSDSLAAAQTAKVDMGASAAPALKGPADAAQPVGISSGPRQIVTRGDTTGTGTAVNMAGGSSVREGVASNRDVLGSPDGGPIADVNTRVGQGLMRGEGGNGTGGNGNNADCLERPEVKAYIENQIRQRMYSRWAAPGDAPVGSKVELRFQLDSSGSLITSSLKSASDSALGQSAVDALRSSAPFMAMPDRVRCLARRELTGTFTLPSAAGG